MALELYEAFIELRVRAEEVKKDVEKGLKEVNAESSGKSAGEKFAAGFKKATSELAKVGVVAWAAAAVFAIKTGGDLENSQIKLERAIKSTGQSAEELTPALAAARSRMEDLGYTNAQTNTSLASMTLATGDTKTAIGLLGTAADLAASKGIDLQAATKLVDMAAGGANRALKTLNVTVASGSDWAKATAAAQKILSDQIASAGGAAAFARQHHMDLATAQQLIQQAAQGSIPALNRLGIDVLPKTATAAQRAAEFQRLMNQRIGGEAKTAAQTAEGQWKILQARFTDLAAQIGVKLMPILLNVFTWLNKTHVLIPALIGVMGVLTAAVIAQAIAWQATPFGWIADGIAGIVAAVLLLKQAWDKSSGFRDFMYNLAAGILIDARVIVGAFKFIADAFLNFVGTILHGAADAFGWIPGLGGKLKTADRAFHDFHSSVDSHINGMMDTMSKWQHQLEDAANQSHVAGQKIQADFVKQGKAAKDAKADLGQYTAAVTDHGTKSEQARPPRQHLIEDLTKAGVSAKTAKSDVENYTTAVQDHGVKSDQARAARKRLIEDITAAWQNSQQGKADVDKLTEAIRNHSSTSDQVRAARQRLLQDLINAGVDAKTAHSYVDGLTDALNNMPKNPTTVLHLGGVGTIAINASGAYIQGESGHIVASGSGYAAGTSGAAPGWAWVGEKGPELAHFWGGETVIPNHALHGLGGLPGYAAGTPFGHTPAEVMAWMQGQAGHMEGVFAAGAAQAFTKGFEKAVTQSVTGAMAGGAGGGVQRWAPAAALALAMAGAPAYLLHQVLYQMQTESGGNPFAVNLTDINAKLGHPSVGLLQLIGGTYAAFAAPRFGYPPPVAYGVSEAAVPNIYGAIKYAQAVYGPSLMSGGSGLGSGHGYATGGRIPEDVLGIGASGAGYLFHGGEIVTPAGEPAQVDTGLERHLAVIADLLAAVPGETGAALGDVLNGLARSASRSAVYGVSAYG